MIGNNSPDFYGIYAGPNECRGQDTHVDRLRKGPGFPGPRWTVAEGRDTV